MFRLFQAVKASAAVRTDENQRELWAKVTHINESEHSGFNVILRTGFDILKVNLKHATHLLP